MPRRSGDAHFYRLSYPLAGTVVARAKTRPLPDEPNIELEIDYSHHAGRISVLEPLRGKTGMLRLDCLTVDTLGQAEDHLLLSVVASDGTVIPADVAGRLLTIGGVVDRVRGQVALDYRERLDAMRVRLTDLVREQEATVRRGISERSASAFEAEAEKLDGWADDMKLGLEREMKELDRQIKDARTSARLAVSLEEKLASQKRMRTLESDRNTRRRALFESQDEIDSKCGALIAQLEAQLTQNVTSECLFCVAEHAHGVFGDWQPVGEVPNEVALLVRRRSQPGVLPIIEHGIEQHHPLEHPHERRGLPEPAVPFAYGRPQRLVVDVEHAPAMLLAGRNRPSTRSASTCSSTSCGTGEASAR